MAIALFKISARTQNKPNERNTTTKPAPKAPRKEASKMKITTVQTSTLRAKSLTAIGAMARTLALTLTVCAGLGASTPSVLADSGHVLPPTAKPHGWTIDDMAAAVANFSISGNNLAYYPDTPFQIIYRHPGNAFTLKPGTFLFVKVIFIDDSAPVIGDWPASKSEAGDYFFGRTELGAHDLEIEIDGRVFSLDDPGYVGGPVPTPNSPDGSEHFIQTGAFVTPLSPGTHTLTIRGVLDGDAMIAATGGFPFATEITYAIKVQ
jgi:hypothetical protein